MLDHVSIPVADLQKAAQFYDAVLRCLGMVRRKEWPGSGVGFGPVERPAPVFWVLQRGDGAAMSGPGLHVSFQAPDRLSVDAFHQAALSAGAQDAGAPGLRPQYTQPFYGAFVYDLDGFKIEAVCRS